MGKTPMRCIFPDMDTNQGPDHIRRERWAGGPYWPVRKIGAEIRCSQESWSVEFEEFDGAWMLEECRKDLSPGDLAMCFARMLVARAAGRAIHQELRGEDLEPELGAAHAYLARLGLAPIDMWLAKRVLGLLQPFDAEALAGELMSLSFTAAGEGLDLSARSLAQLAYDAASGHACHRAAQSAALTLSRLAELQESPRAARRWRAIAYLHGRRADPAEPEASMDA